mmetsp:Transcript_29200/g.86428  ORF Transcript_29200/g.86428 Transcript_29200/m.86428 type:complete len:225 (-) Transcript_29200:1914-2588(-)
MAAAQRARQLGRHGDPLCATGSVREAAVGEGREPPGCVPDRRRRWVVRGASDLVAGTRPGRQRRVPRGRCPHLGICAGHRPRRAPAARPGRGARKRRTGALCCRRRGHWPQGRRAQARGTRRARRLPHQRAARVPRCAWPQRGAQRAARAAVPQRAAARAARVAARVGARREPEAHRRRVLAWRDGRGSACRHGGTRRLYGRRRCATWPCGDGCAARRRADRPR